MPSTGSDILLVLPLSIVLELGVELGALLFCKPLVKHASGQLQAHQTKMVICCWISSLLLGG